MAMIKAQYLGAEKQKKKVLKPSEKFRFNFDWEVRPVSEFSRPNSIKDKIL